MITGTIEIDSRLFEFGAVETRDLANFTGTDSLAESEADTAFIRTGVRAGAVRVSVEVVDQEPTSTDLVWTAVTEVSIGPCPYPRGVLQVAYANPEEDLVGILPATQSQEWYRLRVHATGRYDNYDGFGEDPDAETYLLILWPEPTFRPLLSLRRDKLSER